MTGKSLVEIQGDLELGILTTMAKIGEIDQLLSLDDCEGRDWWIWYLAKCNREVTEMRRRLSSVERTIDKYALA